MTQNTWEKERLEIHFFYIVLILGAMLIFTINTELTPQPNFTEYLGNAATLASLVLALVAIFYSFISNNSLAQSLGNISRISDEIDQTRKQLEVVAKDSTQLVSSSTGIATSVGEMSQVIDHRLSELQGLLDSIHGRLNPLADRFDSFSATVTDALANPRPQSVTSSIGAPSAANEDLESIQKALLDNGSLYGNFAIYAVLLSEKNQKWFKYENIKSVIGAPDYYLQGYLVALSSTGLIDLTSKKDEYLCKNIENYLRENAERAVLESIEYSVKRAKKDQTSNVRAKWFACKENLEAFFSGDEGESAGGAPPGEAG